jgi:membrane associated rhomboid family serine protease
MSDMIDLWSVSAIMIMVSSLVYPFLRRAMMSLTIAVGLFIIYMLEIVPQSPILSDLAFSPLHLSSGVAIYTVFTSMFLHASMLHIIFNVIWLVILGLLFEERMGAKRFLSIYLIAGVAGNIAYGLINFGENSFAVGASGAIFGILGAVLVLYPFERTGMMVFPLPIPNAPVWLIVLIMLALQMIFLVNPGSHVAWQAHLGGLLAGMAVAPIIMRIRPREEFRGGQTIDIMSFANTPEERGIASKIKSESISQVRDAWLEELAKTARCPKCQQPLQAMKGGLKCHSGHKFKIRG